MKHKSDLAVGWLSKGDSDLKTARLIADADGPYDTACFHAQQAIEKYLKSLLAFYGLDIPRTHDLEELQLICAQFVDFNQLSLEELSNYAVSVRYDFEFWPDVEAAKEALIVVEKIRGMIAPYILQSNEE